IGARPHVPLASSALAEAARHAAAFNDDERALVVRTPSMTEGRAACAAIAAAAGSGVAFIEGEPPVGLGLWLALRDLVPAFVYELGPNDRRRLPSIAGYDGPVLALAGLEGTIDRDGVSLPSWRLTMPTTAERVELWRAGIEDDALARTLAV